MTKEEMWSKAVAEDPTIKLELGSKDIPAIECEPYGDGCMYGMNVIAKKMLIIAVNYKTEDDAIRAAIRFDGYFVKNWMFDRVQGEPVLEDFVKKVYDAKRARELYK
jgi:hypothetical protein